MRVYDGLDALDDSTRAYLIARAGRALGEALGRVDAVSLPPRPLARRLDEPSRLFVSWYLGERLVGCIGTLRPTRTLEAGVEFHAVRAGLHDPRTPPLPPDRLLELRCEISLLSEPRPLGVLGLEPIAGALVPHVDGVILGVGERRAVFLPVVWSKLPDVVAFLHALCRKAGIDPNTEGDRAVAEVFTAESFGAPLSNRSAVLEELS
jgi:uncharacterized protein